MTDKELRRLRREDLLQILIGQQRQIEELTQALEDSEKALQDRRIAIEESGSIAEAALRLNDVFAKAQEASDHYIEENRLRIDALRDEAEKAAGEARKRAEKIESEAKREADRLLAQARREAERIQADAERVRAEAERALAEAQRQLSDKGFVQAARMRETILAKGGIASLH